MLIKIVQLEQNGGYNLVFEVVKFILSHSAAGGEIFDQCVAEREEAFKEKDVKRLMKQILEGVSFLHRNNVVHLDLKVRLLLCFSSLISYLLNSLLAMCHTNANLKLTQILSSYSSNDKIQSLGCK